MSNNKKYITVLLGLFICFIGGLLYINMPMDNYGKFLSEKQKEIKKYLSKNKENYKDNRFIPEKKPTKLHEYFDDKVRFIKTAKHTKKSTCKNIKKLCKKPCLKSNYKNDNTRSKNFIYSEEILSDAKIICLNTGCKNNIVTPKNLNITVKMVKPYRIIYSDTPVVSLKLLKVKVLSGNLYLSKNDIKYLRTNTDVMGDLYIDNLNYLKMPKNFRVFGNIYLSNSKGLTFTDGNYVKGHIFVSGNSSVRPIPKTSYLKGQIFI